MNTLFKFYSQVWVMLGIAIAATLPALIDWVSQWREGLALCAGTPCSGILVALGLVFPILGTANRVDDRFPGPRPARNTLDGMAFMSVGQYSWPTGENTIELRYDYDAIRWLQENVTGTPVLGRSARLLVSDVNGQNSGYDYYRAGGLRVSSMTGLPAFLGQHQGEQRFGNRSDHASKSVASSGRPPISPACVRSSTNSTSITSTSVSSNARSSHPSNLSKFDVLVDLGEAEIVYENEGVTIYQMIPK